MSESEEKDLLFGGFSRVSKRTWKKEAERTLGKGRSYEDLVWETEDGIAVEPLYTREEAADFVPRRNGPPGEFPFARGTRRGNNRWLVAEYVEATDPAEAAERASSAVKSGADYVIFRLEGRMKRREMRTLTRYVYPLRTSFGFEVSGDPRRTAELFVSNFEREEVDASELRGGIFFDPVGAFLAVGDTISSVVKPIYKIAETIDYLSGKSPDYGAFTVGGSTFRDAGATVVQELAFTVAAAAEYLVRLRFYGIGVDDACRHMVFCFSAGSGYFEEIAKLRAARVLWANVVRRFDPKDESSGKMRIHCRTSRFNKTVFDPHANMLRATTEALAAVIGGTDSLAVDPFDFHGGEPDEFSRRIARNIQLLLMREARMDAVADPGGGSYLLEKLTREIAGKSLELFQRVEAEGGFLECARSGFIQSEVKRSGRRAADDVCAKKRILVGTNEFPNPLEKIPDGLFEEAEKAVAKEVPKRKSGVRPLPPSRAARRFELTRALGEKNAERTKGGLP